MPSIGRAIAFTLTGIPAAIGVAFVARYAYATSDTADTGLAAAALYGMTAAAAFAGPAAAIAVGNAGRKAWACAFGVLACLAIVANGTNTLGAIAQRGAGTEAAVAKAKDDVAGDRKELARLASAILDLEKFTPTDADAVAAARGAVDAAERSRKAECGNGDPRQRGSNCRSREADEATARTALSTATTGKAATDKAAKLEDAAAAIRARLAKAPATPSTNALGEALGRFFSISAASAATAQQALISAIVELVIAATLALPELLRPTHTPAARREETEAQEREPAPANLEPAAAATQEATTAIVSPAEISEAPAPTAKRRPRAIGGVQMAATPAPAAAGSVPAFMLACLPRADGEAVPLRVVYARYHRWCGEQSPAAAALDVGEFGSQFRALCDRLRIRSERRGDQILCLDVRLSA